MGFKEIFVFVVVGCLAIYHQRSQQHTNNQLQIFILWILAVVLPSLAITWATFNSLALPLNFVALVFLLCIWMYSNFSTSLNSNLEVINLDLKEEKILKDCFSSNVYHLTGLEYRPQEIYCRGNLRSQNPKYAYESINQNIQNAFGNRFVCYLQEIPLENLGTSFGRDQNSQENTTNYCFYLTPNNLSNSQLSLSDRQGWIASTISIVFTAFTVLVVGSNQRIESLSISNLQQGIPYLLGITSIFIARSITQYYIAKQYRLRLLPPLLLPCLGSFGLLGSLNPNFPTGQNPTNQRRILFDLAVIPTIVGLGISIVLLFLGNWILVPATMSIADSAIEPSLLITNLDTDNSKSSIFVTLLQTIFSIGQTALTPDAIATFSPLTVAGWAGLALSALQLMPFDLLDGGNLIIAMFGYRQAIQIARIARLVLLAISLLAQPWLQIYCLLFFVLPTPRPLILNEHTEIGKTRDLIGMILIAIALLIILPIPKALLL
jgi:membrane-associated protease RseP (regulator of RpoE activity)